MKRKQFKNKFQLENMNKIKTINMTEHASYRCKKIAKYAYWYMKLKINEINFAELKNNPLVYNQNLQSIII